MYERLTWHPFDPAPYESGWSIFIKLLALNFCKPTDLEHLIRKQGCAITRNLEFNDSSWIDFGRFSSLIGVTPNRLRAGFLDQLCFPQFTYSHDTHGIRFCPECLKFGYHSVFFDLALITECPIHQIPLQKGCTACFKAVKTSGLVREASPYQLDGGVIHDFAWRADTYHSKCGHIYFDPERILGISRFDYNQRRDIRRACEQFIRWWIKAFTSTNRAPGLIARLAQVSFEGQDDRSLSLCMDIAIKLAGKCPWPTAVSPSPANWLTSSRAKSNVAEGRLSIEPESVDFESDLGKIYRSVRRHLFKKYIRPSHFGCWREMAAYELEMSRSISSGSVCVMVLAYMSWRMTIEGFSNIEGFSLRKQHTPKLMPLRFIENSAVELANFWYAQFFAILGRIEEIVQAGGHFYIERSSPTSRFVGYSEFVPNIESGASRGTWYIAFPDKDRATRIASSRCGRRSKGPESMQNAGAANQVDTWGWNGEYTYYSRANLLFRVKDEAKNSSRRYTTLSI